MLVTKMKFQVLLLALAFVIATNVHCQAQAQQGDSDKSPDQTLMSRHQDGSCNCSERRNGLKLNCPCVPPLQRNILSNVQKASCKKKGIRTFKKCQQLFLEGNRKGRKGNKGLSTPF